MVVWLRKYPSSLVLVLFFSNWFIELESVAQLIPRYEVKTLQTISQKLKNPYWNVSQISCNDGGQSLNKTFADSRNLSNVTCDCSFNRSTVCHVTIIQLQGLNLTGSMPEELGNLAHLQEIELTRNYINGTIPKSLSKIPLVSLVVSETRITGSIPDEIGQITTLQKLSLEDNQLRGSLPQSLGNLRKLRSLVLASNFFNGTIPETFANLKNVIELRLNGNMISGKIPNFLGNLTSLVSLDIQGTSMEGPIPSSLSLLTNLQILAISDLKSESIPFPNLASLTNLRRLVLRNCLIAGPIPNYFRNLVNLTLLDLSYNQLSGPIPESIGNVKHLAYLFLTNNSLSGELPQWILTSKNNIDMSYNNFTGSAPGSCQQSNVNLVASFSAAKGNDVSWCLMKDLPCSTKPQYHSMFINCGGSKMSFEGNEYEEDSTPGSPSIFFSYRQKWAYSSTGVFQFRSTANFITQTSVPNITGIYQTARLAPLSLKYYGLCMQQGSYTVKLHFAEIMFTNDNTFSSNGRRIFDVAIQGNVVLKDFNIVAEAGGAGKVITKDFKNVYVNGSTLEIFLYWAGKGTTAVPQRSVYGPLISGITVTPNFKVSTARLSNASITGIVLASSFVILVSALLILWLTGYLGGKDHSDEGKGASY